MREVSWELRTHFPTPYPSSSLVNTFPAEMAQEGQMDLLMLPSQVPGLGRVLTGDDFPWQRKVWLPSCRDRFPLLPVAEGPLCYTY